MSNIQALIDFSEKKEKIKLKTSDKIKKFHQDLFINWEELKVN